MKHQAAIILITLMVTQPWCRAQTAEDQNALKSFNSLIRRHVESYKPNGREHVTELGGGWVKERFTLVPSSVKFDVEKTASLVSPYVGTVTFTMIRQFTAFHPTRTDAANDDVFTKKDRSIHTHVFAYQDHQWQPTRRQYRDVDATTDSDYPCDEFLSKEDPSERDIHGCLEEFDGK
jgi:hypothetical protein